MQKVDRFRKPIAITHGVTARAKAVYRSPVRDEECFEINSILLDRKEATKLAERIYDWGEALDEDAEAREEGRRVSGGQ